MLGKCHDIILKEAGIIRLERGNLGWKKRAKWEWLSLTLQAIMTSKEEVSRTMPASLQSLY